MVESQQLDDGSIESRQLEQTLTTAMIGIAQVVAA